MSLRNKVLLIISVTFVSLSALLYFTSRIVLVNSFAKLEERNTSQNVERVRSALSGELASLEAITGNWASSDAAYAFIRDSNEKYIQSNLLDGTFIELNLNLALFVDASGRTVYGKAFDLKSRKEIPVPPGMREHLTTSSPLLAHADTQSRISGIVILPEGPMLVAARPILTGEDKGPIRGTLITGRYLDAAEIQRLAEVTQFTLAVYRPDDPRMPTGVREAYSSLSAQTPVVGRALDKDTIAGYTLLTDIDGKPSLVLSVSMPRDIYRQGQATVLYLILLIVAVGLIFAMVTMLLLENQVLSRLARLSNNVSSIATSADLAARVSATGTDEVANLAAEINLMLAKLEWSEEELRKTYEKEKELRQELQTEIQRRVEFTRALVHELKTPLTPIMASSDALVAELREETLLSLARNINRGASNLNRRIDELLDLARGEVGMLKLEIKQVDLSQLLREAVEEMRPLAARYGQSLLLELPPSMPLVRADEERLRQIVFNLINNACKFTSEGGRITVRAGEKDARLIVAVQDTGSGIASEDQQRLFQPYHQLEGAKPGLSGLGLGLSLCKILVELHGGQISVESQLGVGSTFSFWVPLAAAGRSEEGSETGGQS
jgi:signal transduction histidine kinase